MRKFVIAGNWKMYKTIAEAEQLTKAIKGKTTSIEKTQIIICPPAMALETVSSIVKDCELLSAPRICIGKAREHLPGKSPVK